jgi:3-phosphoshikimate 1-carboxyvinyltransferase
MGSLIPALEITPVTAIERLTWNLSPSKSHAIRWLALGAQSKQDVVLQGLQNAGQDIVSMRRCLGQMGVRITDIGSNGEVLNTSSNHDDQPAEGSVAWKIQGVGPEGLKPPISVLHAGNSGTALRILMALCARFEVPVMLDGDASLRSRNHDVMIGALEQMGVKVSYGAAVEGLPLLVEGPWAPPPSLELDVSTSSQPMTAWHLAAPALPKAMDIMAVGEGVSLRHSGLTQALCERTGAASGLHDGHLKPWVPALSESVVKVPLDASMLSFACLAAKVSGAFLELNGLPPQEDALGNDLLLNIAPSLGLVINPSSIELNGEPASIEVNLQHANDLITPLAALLAIGGGGRIVGAEHAAFKETDRTHGTAALLAQFGLTSAFEDGVLFVEGGQSIVQPEGLVRTFGDHRMQMTALVLAMGCTETVLVEGSDLHEVADPEAVQRWQAAGVNIETVLHQPW